MNKCTKCGSTSLLTRFINFESYGQSKIISCFSCGNIVSDEPVLWDRAVDPDRDRDSKTRASGVRLICKTNGCDGTYSRAMSKTKLCQPCARKRLKEKDKIKRRLAKSSC